MFTFLKNFGGGEFLYINTYKIIFFFKPRPKKPTHNTNAVHVHTETVKLADFAINSSNCTISAFQYHCMFWGQSSAENLHTYPGPTSLSTELLFLNRF